MKFTIFHEGSKGELTGDDNWLFTSEEYEENLQGDLSRAEYFERISQTHNYFQQRDISLVVVLIPSKSRIYSHKIPAYPQSEELLLRYTETIIELQNSDITVVNLEKAFANQKEIEQLFYKYDTHWTFEGARLSARQIQKQIDPIIIQNNLQERDFSMNILSEKPFEGDLLDYIPTLKVEWEFFNETEIIDNNPPVLGMFDSIEIPVILVGTSYSADSGGMQKMP